MTAMQAIPKAIYMQSQRATLKKKSMKKMIKIVKKNTQIMTKLTRIIQQ